MLCNGFSLHNTIFDPFGKNCKFGGDLNDLTIPGRPGFRQNAHTLRRFQMLVKHLQTPKTPLTPLTLPALIKHL